MAAVDLFALHEIPWTIQVCENERIMLDRIIFVEQEHLKLFNCV